MTNMIHENCIARYDEVSAIKKGDVIFLKDRPCKVTEVHTSKGHAKHGHAKAIIKARDVLNEKNIEYSHATSDMIPVPEYSREEYLLTYLEEDDDKILLSVLDKKDNQIDFDLDCNDNNDSGNDITIIRKLIKEYSKDLELNVEIIQCCGKVKLASYRPTKDVKNKK